MSLKGLTYLSCYYKWNLSCIIALVNPCTQFFWFLKKKQKNTGRKVSKALVICLAGGAGCSIKFCFPKEGIGFILHSKQARERGQTIKTFPGGESIRQELQRSHLINKHLHFSKLISPQEISLILIMLPYVMFYKRYMRFIDFLLLKLRLFPKMLYVD